MILFHAANPNNIEAILTQGLLPSKKWEDKFPVKPEGYGTSIDIRNQSLVFLVDTVGSSGPEDFVDKVMFQNRIPIMVQLPKNWSLQDLGYNMGIHVSRQTIPPQYLRVMSRKELSHYFPEIED